MRSKAVGLAALVALACSAGMAQAQKGKHKALPRLDVFSPMVYAVEPNIDAVLLLTEEQQDKLHKAIEETIHAPALLDLKPKKGEAPDKDKQAKFKEEMAKAKAELKKQAEAIITTDQKATIQKVDEAIKKALDGVLTKEQKDKLQGLQKPKKAS
jgi:hypothetical protein